MQQKLVTYRKIQDNDFTIVIDKSTRRLQVVITKKVAQRAVDRNRIRRIFKEALKSHDFKKNQIRVIVRKNIAGLKSQELEQRLKILNVD